MRFKEYLFMSLKDLWRRKGRTILTCLGITIGTLLIVSMVGLGIGFNKFISDFVNSSTDSRSIYVAPIKYLSEEEAEDLDPMTYMDDYYKKIDLNTINEIKDTGKVDSLSAYIYCNIDKIKINDKEYDNFFTIYGYNLNEDIFSDSIIKSIREEEKDKNLTPIKEGRNIEKSGEVLLSEKTLEGLKLTRETVLNKELIIIMNYINGVKIQKPIEKKLTIVGIVDDKFMENNIFICSDEDVSYLKEATTLQKDYLNNIGYDELGLLVNDIEDVKIVTNKLKDMDYSSQSALDMANSIDEKLGSISVGLALLGVIVLIVASIGIINTMSMTVLERTRSIGVMKSVGANRTTIRTIFLVQASVIGLIGGTLGILIGNGINLIIEFFINNYISNSGINMSITVGLPGYLVVATLLFAILISLLAGIYPANKASKLDAIEALRR